VRCGYGFLEDGGAGPRARAAVLLTAGALAVVAAALAILLIGGGEAEQERGIPDVRFRTMLEVLSDHPLSARAAERRLEARFTSLRDDDSAAARCSAREPRPAHAVRRCLIRYPNGATRTVVLLTNARGSEVLAEP
jgi:hypothetical protein